MSSPRRSPTNPPGSSRQNPGDPAPPADPPVVNPRPAGARLLEFSRRQAFSRRLAFWRSPADQPAWARPALLALTAIAGLLYAWNATGNLEIYYAATARSMSMSLHNFFFAAFDPQATISVDKLPGALWVQALSLRIFGVHAWALVAPQVVEGLASVLLLFRVVRRLCGPLAGIVAAAVLVLSPATVALNRGNIPDTLMILLLLAAADATISAIVSGRMRILIVAGVLVGLAFQAKMVEAWLILPAFALAYLVATSDSWRRRLTRLGVTGLVVGAVSLAWMVIVSLWPASQRPYVDGSTNDSLFSQVFVYNGFGRLDQPSPNQLLTKAIGLRLGSTSPGWDRLLGGALGLDTAWLMPAALIALIALAACLVACRRIARPRDNRLLLASSALWGTWLLVLLVVFSASSTVNSYYTAALSPPIAGLLGMGLVLAVEHRASRPARLAVAAAVAITCGYAVWLLPGAGVGLVTGLPEIVIVLGVAAVAALLLPARYATRAGVGAVAAAAVLAAPAAASSSVVANAFGPFDTPFEPTAASQLARSLGAIAGKTEALLPPLENAIIGPDLAATQTSALAAPFIYDSGLEVLPIGGYTGTIPQPSLASLEAMVARGDFHLVIQSPTVTDPRLLWVARTCRTLNAGPRPVQAAGGLRFATYFCGRLPIL